MTRVARPGGLALGALALAAGACAPAPARVEPGDEVALTDLGSARPSVKPDVLSVESWSFQGHAGSVIRTHHYRIYTTETDRILRDRLASFSEYALVHYRTAIVPLPAPPQRLDTYLMDNRPQWENLTRRIMGPASRDLSAIQRGGFATRGIGVFYDLGLYDTLAIASHEGWHQYTQRTFADALPVWLEEGVATYMEGHRWRRAVPDFRSWANVERYDALMEAHRAGTLMSLQTLVSAAPADLLDRTDGSILAYYAQLWALVHFLDEGAGGRYRAGLQGVLTDAARGTLRRSVAAQIGRSGARAAMASRSGIVVFETYFTADIDRADREYRAFVRRLASPGVRSKIAQGDSPVTPVRTRGGAG